MIKRPRKTPEAENAPDETRMTADLPTARIEVSHRADAETGEEIMSISLRAHPSMDAAMGLLGPAAMASLFSAAAPQPPSSSEQGGAWAFSPSGGAADPLAMWTNMWGQWATMWAQPFAMFGAFGGAPTMCGPLAPKKPDGETS